MDIFNTIIVHSRSLLFYNTILKRFLITYNILFRFSYFVFLNGAWLHRCILVRAVTAVFSFSCLFLWSEIHKWYYFLLIKFKKKLRKFITEITARRDVKVLIWDLRVLSEAVITRLNKNQYHFFQTNLNHINITYLITYSFTLYIEIKIRRRRLANGFRWG